MPNKLNEITIYQGEPASALVLAQETAKIHVLFPKLDKLFVPLLIERLSVNNFTEKRVKDAISYLIDNFKYQNPSIADIVSFDKKIKIYSHNDVVQLVTENKADFSDFYKHWIGETLYRVKKTEADNLNMTKFLNQNKNPNNAEII